MGGGGGGGQLPVPNCKLRREIGNHMLTKDGCCEAEV